MWISRQSVYCVYLEAVFKGSGTQAYLKTLLPLQSFALSQYVPGIPAVTPLAQ